MTDRYNIMCSIDAHEKQQKSYLDGYRIICDNALPPN